MSNRTPDTKGMKTLAVFVSAAAFGVAGVAIANGTGRPAPRPATANVKTVREGTASPGDQRLASLWDGQGPGTGHGEDAG
jgi:hypothetical protein